MKYIFSLLTTLLVVSSHSQNKNANLVKRPTVFVQLSSFDFKTAPAIVQTSLGDVLSNGQWNSLKDNYNGLGISLLKGITTKIDFAASINGAKVFYPFRNQLNYRTRGRLYELDMALNFKLLTDNHVVVPYLTAGIGGYYFRETNGSYAPLGAGIQVNIANKFFLFTSFQYRLPVTNEAQHHFLYNLSIGLPLTKQQSGKPATSAVTIPQATVRTGVRDTDADGTPDTRDKCPNVAGPITNNGCPLPPSDTDNDGVADSLDQCPTVAGATTNNGCPVPPQDADQDGIIDSLDQCPTLPGSIANNGCPLPPRDADQDGVVDSLDQCPTVPGTIANKGCPLPPLDADQDGVVDTLDQCPTLPGLASYHGCPIPDSDKDGVPDPVDKCPNDPGTQKYEGCPVPDTDGDGVDDEKDKCPTQAGLAVNAGCPLPAKMDSLPSTKKPAQKAIATYQIYFLSDVTILPDAAFKILNGIGELLNTNKELTAQITGYTDNMEFPQNRKGNALKRAQTVTNYLMLLGVDNTRLTTIGIGPANPKATNQTMLGRSLNRRVEIKISN